MKLNTSGHVDTSRPVKVYRNLNKKCFSVIQDGRVRCHALFLYLIDVKFKVSEAGRLRVVKDKRKNVHAFIEGLLVPESEIVNLGLVAKPRSKVTYDPYSGPTFVNQRGKPMHSALGVVCWTNENKPQVNLLTKGKS